MAIIPSQQALYNSMFGITPGLTPTTYSPETADLGGAPTMGELYKSTMAGLKGYGQQEKADLEQNYRNAMGMAMQSLASTGLLGTTAAASMRMGFFKQYSQALNRLSQKLNETKLQYKTQLGSAANQQALAYAQLNQNAANQAAQLQLGYAGLNARTGAATGNSLLASVGAENAKSAAMMQQAFPGGMGGGGGGMNWFSGENPYGGTPMNWTPDIEGYYGGYGTQAPAAGGYGGYDMNAGGHMWTPEYGDYYY